MKTVNPCSLYLIAESSVCTAYSIEDVVNMAVQQGVDIVQIREKNRSKIEIFQLGKSLKPLLKQHNVTLIINDHVDIAKELDADGVHVGQSDMDYKNAREILGPEKIIGLSVTNLEQLNVANKLDVNYLGVGPVFSTNTKLDASPTIGLEGLNKIVDLSRHPIYAIGGISIDNYESVLATGVKGIAVASAVCAAENPARICGIFTGVNHD